MLLIIEKMPPPPGYSIEKMLALMRQVSRSWRAAVESYSGSLSMYSVFLEDYCHFLPNLSSLHVEMGSKGSDMGLSDLQACTRLSSLSLDNLEDRTIRLDVGNLPASLRSLSLFAFSIDAEDVEQLPCTGLTQLSWVHTFRPADFALLLPRISKLQVRASPMHKDMLQIVPGKFVTTLCTSDVLVFQSWHTSM